MRASSSGPVLCTHRAAKREVGLPSSPPAARYPATSTGRISLLAVPLVGLADLVGGLIVSHPPGTPITGPDRRHPEALALGVGAEPDGTIARFAEPLGGREELVQGHRLAEGEPLGEHPLSRLDPGGERGVRLGPGGIEGRVVP